MEGSEVLPSAADTLVLPLVLPRNYLLNIPPVPSVRGTERELLVGDAAARY